MEEQISYRLPFEEYLKQPRKYGKFVGAITKSQYALLTNYLTHDDMVKELKKKIRPDVLTDGWGNAINDNENFMNSNVLFCGYEGYFQMELPMVDMLSQEQFDYVKNILNGLKEFNKKIDEQGYGTKYEINVFGVGNVQVEWENYDGKIDELLDKLKCYVKKPENIEKETIIGKPLIRDNKVNEEKTEEILLMESLPNYDSIDWDNDFPVNKDVKNEWDNFDWTTIYTPQVDDREVNKKIRGYSSILIISLITGIISILLIVLGIFINSL